MKKLAVFVAITCLSNFSFGQIKKKLLGVYEGKVPTYELNTGTDLIQVKEATIQVDLTAIGLSITVGNQKKMGTYNIVLDTDSYYVLEAILENQAAPERILLYKKGKKLSREGLTPQPDALLVKMKK